MSGIRSFTREKLHYPTENSFPWVGCKGSDSIHLLGWLRWYANLQLHAYPGSTVLQKIAEGCTHGLAFQCMHRHGFFCRPQCAAVISESCKKFCHAYAEMAAIAFSQGRTFYAMVPKAHAFCHVYHALDLGMAAGHHALCNPAVFDCSMAEDFVGKIARQSRRVSYRHVVENTLLAYRVKAKLVIQRFKKDKGL